MSRLEVLNLNNIGGGWITRNPTGSPPSGWGRSMGAVYHSPSQAIIVGGIANGGAANGTLYKLAVPADPFTGTYAWSTITNNGGGVTPSTNLGGQYAGTFGKFRMIENMGGAAAAIVMHTQTSGPVFVYKLPTGAI